MKIGNKYLYGNGRGNYHPISLGLRNNAKKVKKRLDSNEYATDTQRKWMESEINALKHGIGLRQLRKGLNSKLRQIAKREINKEISDL